MAERAPTSAHADRFPDFAEAVEGLLGRRVDLVSELAIRNPFLRREVEAPDGWCIDDRSKQRLSAVQSSARSIAEWRGGLVATERACAP
jgi:hypothetical protein